MSIETLSNEVYAKKINAITRLNKLVNHLQFFDSRDSQEKLAHVISEAASEIEMIIDEME